MRLLLPALCALAACGHPAPPSDPESPPLVAKEPAPSPASDAAPIAVVAPSPPDAAPGPPPDAAPAIATWPFTAWDRAEAFTYNHVDYGPGIPLMVYDESTGWSPNLVDRIAISQDVAERAVAYTIATRGEIEVSKCPFPRHAIVFYAGDTPVGSVNVCFSCGDVLVWPEFEPRLDDDPDADYSKAEQKKIDKRDQQKFAAYEKTYPKWEALFRDDLGWSIDPWKQ